MIRKIIGIFSLILIIAINVIFLQDKLAVGTPLKLSTVICIAFEFIIGGINTCINVYSKN